MRNQYRILGIATGIGLLVAAAATALSPAEEGRRIFVAANCYGCHGGRAGGRMCPNLRELKPDLATVRQVVKNGTPVGMPAFPSMTDQDIQNIAAYIQSLRTPAEPTFTHWWEALPSQ